jgi:hypothetical protein
MTGLKTPQEHQVTATYAATGSNLYLSHADTNGAAMRLYGGKNTQKNRKSGSHWQVHMLKKLHRYVMTARTHSFYKTNRSHFQAFSIIFLLNFVL